jgi:hypothetical protein
MLLTKKNLQVALFRKLKRVEVRKLSQSVNTNRLRCQVCYLAVIFLHLVQPRNLYQLVKSISSTNWNCMWHRLIEVIQPSSKWLQIVWQKNENYLLNSVIWCHGYSLPKPKVMCKITLWNEVTQQLWRNIFQKYINYITKVLAYIL